MTLFLQKKAGAWPAFPPPIPIKAEPASSNNEDSEKSSADEEKDEESDKESDTPNLDGTTKTFFLIIYKSIFLWKFIFYHR